jgi:DNA-binding NarL/FixJ family response regulator
MRERLTVLIADDHPATRSGLEEILADALPSAQFGNAENADEVMLRLSETRYDLILLDINMPGRSGLDALQEVKRCYPEIPVVIVSVHSEEHYAEPCLKLGAADYVNKNSAPERLVPSVLRILGERRNCKTQACPAGADPHKSN